MAQILQAMWSFLAAAPLLVQVVAIDNGLGRTPPLGWRSWNLFGGSVDQSLIISIMDGMVDRKRTVDGVPTSLCDLGYCDVGLDDNWQACGAGSDGYQYHDAQGNPIVNLTSFPNMADMTAHAHKLGLTAGWYGNNCICRERKEATLAMYENGVHMLTEVFRFDGVKLDGCGTQMDLDTWAGLINKSGRPVVIENCHWGGTVPNATWCPWNFYRSSGDIQASYGSMVGNLMTTVQWAQKNLSGPGCWAYPDMLEVGVKPKGYPGLTDAEARSHFAAWCIVSSPLILSHDVRDDAVMDRVWPIIANKEAIAVNQAWAGHSGSPFKQSEAHVLLKDYHHVVNGVRTAHTAPVLSWQYFYKPLGAGKVAVLLMNHLDTAQLLELQFSEVPGLSCSECQVRDVWARADKPGVAAVFKAQVEGHDAAFLVLSPPPAEIPADILVGVGSLLTHRPQRM